MCWFCKLENNTISSSLPISLEKDRLIPILYDGYSFLNGFFHLLEGFFPSKVIGVYLGWILMRFIMCCSILAIESFFFFLLVSNLFKGYFLQLERPVQLSFSNSTKVFV